MTESLAMPTGGQLVARALRRHGVNRVFCVPGESYLPVLDALYDIPDIAVITCRHEGGAAMMAEATGKLTGEPGICMVTRGPGATNAAAGLHVAYQDSSPMILLIGQVGRSMAEREAFQEIDYRRLFGPVAKWVAQIDDAARVPEFIARAFATAVNGRPGPVVLALPEDMLSETVPTPQLQPAHYRRALAYPGPADMVALEELLAHAQKPMILVGGGGWTQQAVTDLRGFAERWKVPVIAGFRCQDLFDNTHPLYAGDAGLSINPALAQHIAACDVLLVIGDRLGEITTGGYTRLSAPVPQQKLVHVFPAGEELGKVYQPVLAIQAAVPAFLEAAASLPPPASTLWSGWAHQVNTDYHAWSDAPPPSPGGVQLGEIVGWLRQHLPPDAIMTNGAGNYAAWLHRFYRYRRFRTQLAPTSGSMGYGLPAAIAAKAAEPDRMVVALAGDGCLQMTVQELATAMQAGLHIIVLVINNSMYGTIRMHQERHYPGRTIATTLHNPDFVALARAYGLFAERVETDREFPAAFRRAQESGRAALLEVRTDPEAITPTTTLSALRAAGKSGRR